MTISSNPHLSSFSDESYAAPQSSAVTKHLLGYLKSLVSVSSQDFCIQDDDICGHMYLLICLFIFSLMQPYLWSLSLTRHSVGHMRYESDVKTVGQGQSDTKGERPINACDTM